MVKVFFIHPDLGIGGAERLVIDAALALKKKGHDVTFFTAHHDPTHCFPETIDGSLSVFCVGDWLPRSTFGLFYAFWAYIRMIYIALHLHFINIDYDVLFIDQISACIPVFRRKKNTKIIFYCHYPDQLLTERKTFLKRIYRYFIDKVEESTTKMADMTLVNSKFTAGVFKNTFKSISVSPSVLYPTFDFSKFDTKNHSNITVDSELVTFLSLNRYERKKNIALAIHALHSLLNSLQSCDRNKVELVIAGGYDHRVKENIEYYSELVALAENLKIQDRIQFLKSPSDDEKLTLLNKASCLLYTPSNEHFGIVPIEAMCVGTPVLAVNSGGPKETVVDGETGYLRESDAEEFATVMKDFVTGSVTKSSMSKVCQNHVVSKFSFQKFADYLNYVVQGLIDGRKQR